MIPSPVLLLRKGLLFLAALAVTNSAARGAGETIAKPLLHPMFSDNAVLQRDRPIPIWGWTKPRGKVVVWFDGRTQTVRADDDGRWTVSMRAHPAGGAHSLSVTDAESGATTRSGNLLFGDVWICGGQSNMAYDLYGANNPEEEIAAADHPEIRLLQVPNAITAKPIQAFEGVTWQVCSPQTVARFSGVGYFFGRKLHRELKVPIGLVNSSWSGTPGESWVSGPTLAEIPGFKDRVHAIGESTDELKDPNAPMVLYNGKIAPLMPAAVKGVVWYQGESNADNIAEAEQYRDILPAIITDWRAGFGADLPFHIMQLANFKARDDEPRDDAWPRLREVQLQTSQRLPNTGLVVLTDLGEENDVHFPNKQEAGARLAMHVLGSTYGRKIESSGPVLSASKKVNGAFLLAFDHARGLSLKGEKDRVFALAGSDRQFHWASPEISGNRITLRSPEVPRPVFARFAWSNNPRASLYNSAGFPASPFQVPATGE